MDSTIIKQRVAAVAKEIKALGLDGTLLTSKANVAYVTGFTGGDSWALMVGKRVWLLTDSRYVEEAQECSTCKVVLRKFSLSEKLGEIIARQGKANVLGIDSSIPLATYNDIRKKAKAKWKVMGNVVEKIRMFKDPAELKLIRKAIKIADESLEEALASLRVGMTESELAGLLDLAMRRRGTTASFDAIVGFGANGSRNHHVPSGKKLRKNDTILIDFGANYKGYMSDKTRCFAVGKVSSQYRKAYEAVKDSQTAAIAAIADGVSIVEIDKESRRVIKDAGFPVYAHGTGHGIGMEVHEIPFLSRINKDVLQTGQVITIEPGIYIPGKFGIRIEDDVLVLPNGRKILSRGEESPELRVLKAVF